MTKPMTQTKNHTWVKHTITPVEVLTDDDNEPVVFVDPDAQDQAEAEAAYGCDACGASMATDLHTECEGEPA